MSELGEFGAWHMEFAPTWHRIPVEPSDLPWPEFVAEALADGADAQDRLVRTLLRRHDDLLGEQGASMMAGVWVPERSTGKIAGQMYLDLIVPDSNGRPATREYYRSLIDPDRRVGVETLERELVDLDLPAGAALRRREIIALPGGRFHRSRLIQENVIYTVFPPGCCDAVEFTCTSPQLHRGEALATDAANAVASLAIKLAESSV